MMISAAFLSLSRVFQDVSGSQVPSCTWRMPAACLKDVPGSQASRHLPLSIFPLYNQIAFTVAPVVDREIISLNLR